MMEIKVTTHIALYDSFDTFKSSRIYQIDKNYNLDTDVLLIDREAKMYCKEIGMNMLVKLYEENILKSIKTTPNPYEILCKIFKIHSTASIEITFKTNRQMESQIDTIKYIYALDSDCMDKFIKYRGKSNFVKNSTINFNIKYYIL